MKQLSKLDQLLFAPSNRTTYLAIFRVFVAFHILKKLFFAWPSAEMLFSSNSFVSHYEGVTYLWLISIDLIRDHLKWFFMMYSAFAVLMLFGVGKHWTVLLVAICTDIFQNLNGYLLDGGDNLLKFVLFYLVFADSFSFLSITRLKPKLKFTKLLNNFFTRVAVFCIIAHLCLVYTISGFSKAHAEVWYNGIAVYYIYMNERFMGTSFNPYLAKNIFFTTFSCYFTIVWESCFAFGVFIKQIRIPWLIAGAFMHLGIYIFMMIHEFQWFFIAHYGFFFTNKELRNMKNKLSKQNRFLSDTSD